MIRYIRLFGGVLVFLVTGSVSFAAIGDFQWVAAMGNTGDDTGISVCTDDTGKVYTTGSFQGTVDFDPGAGTYNIPSSGGRDVFISKFSVTGNHVWTKTHSGLNETEGISIAVDSSGNVYTAGYFVDTVDFDPGAGVVNHTSSGMEDIFISKLDSNGNFIWVKVLGGTDTDRGLTIALDDTGNIYLSGEFSDTVDIDPGIPVQNFVSNGGTDCFVLKLDSNGDFIWANQIGGIWQDSGLSAELDDADNYHITGQFYGTVDFDPGIATYNLTASRTYSSFVMKIDSNGDFLWAIENGGLEDPYRFTSLALDLNGNIYTTGRFDGTFDFDPGPDVYNLTAGSEDAYITKINPDGTLNWAVNIGSSGYDFGTAIDVDVLGNVYATGKFSNTVDFDPGAGTTELTDNPQFWIDTYLLVLDNDGEFLSAQLNGGHGLDVRNNNGLTETEIITTGQFELTVDFDQGPGVHEESFNGGNGDIYILKLSGVALPPPANITQITASPGLAEVGDTVQISVFSDGTLLANPTVTVNGNPASFSELNGMVWKFIYPVTGSDTLGPATIDVVAQDVLGNVLVESNNTALSIFAVNSVPLAAWPGFLVLAAAGILVLKKRSKM